MDTSDLEKYVMLISLEEIARCMELVVGFITLCIVFHCKTLLAISSKHDWIFYLQTPKPYGEKF